ncbi:hypothetical protein V6N00_13720 [Tersicoccus sp. MR15.9]
MARHLAPTAHRIDPTTLIPWLSVGTCILALLTRAVELVVAISGLWP